MPLRTSIARSLTLLLALTLSGLAPLAAADAQQPDESIPSEFQVYTCPEGYSGDDYLTDCTPAGAGDYSITVTDTSPTEPTATTATDADGFVRFATFPGSTSWSLNDGGQSNDYFSCFAGNGVYLFDGSSDLIRTSLNAGDALSCRWYVIPTSEVGDQSGPAAPTRTPDPADASVGVQIFDCPEGYAEAEYADDCEPTTRPVGVTLNDGYEYDEATVIRDQAGDEGRAGFVDLEGGQYYLAVEDLSDTTTIYWSCFDDTSGNERFDQDGYHNRVRFYLDPSADSSCRIYLTANGPETPAPGTAGTVTVNVRGCPESYDGPDWSTECTTPIDSNRVAITGYPSQAEGAPNGMEIYDGTAVFQDVQPGTYAPLTDIPGHATVQRSTCVIGAGPIDDALIAESSSIDQPSSDGNGAFDLAAGEGATCVVYITPISLRA